MRPTLVGLYFSKVQKPGMLSELISSYHVYQKLNLLIALKQSLAITLVPWSFCAIFSLTGFSSDPLILKNS